MSISCAHTDWKAKHSRCSKQSQTMKRLHSKQHLALIIRDIMSILNDSFSKKYFPLKLWQVSTNQIIHFSKSRMAVSCPEYKVSWSNEHDQKTLYKYKLKELYAAHKVRNGTVGLTLWPQLIRSTICVSTIYLHIVLWFWFVQNCHLCHSEAVIKAIKHKKCPLFVQRKLSAADV